LQLGEKVLLKNVRRETRMGGKMDTRWAGPYEIAEAKGNGSYKIKNLKTGKVSARAVASTRLKRFLGSDNVSEIESADSE
jgi:hypothetical protein